MLETLIRIIFILLFAITLAVAVVYGLHAYRNGDVVIPILSFLVCALSVYRILYYAKGLATKHEDE